MASRSRVAQRIAELEHEDVAIRRKAVKKLGDYGAPEALPQLCAALQDEHWSVRRQAAVALGDIQDPAAVEALASVFIEHRGKKKYRSVRKQALLSLGRIGTAEAAEIIGEVWRNDQYDVRVVAAQALRQCGLTAVPIACRALAEGYASVTPRASGIWITTSIALHSLPNRHAPLRRSAREILHELLDDHGTKVFAIILGTDKLSPHDKFVCLEILRYRWKTLLLTMYYRDVISYCEQIAASDEDEEVRAGARAVLDYASLARASARPPTAQLDELLRAAAPDFREADGDDLLRGSEAVGDETSQPESEGFLEKALRLFKRN